MKQKTRFRNCRRFRLFLVMLAVLLPVLLLPACGKKDGGGTGFENAGSSGDSAQAGGSDGAAQAGGAANSGGAAQTGNSGGSGKTGGEAQTGNPGGAYIAGAAAQDFVSQYGIAMPDGILSLADPDEIYESGNMIQMTNSEIYIAMKEASDWIDSAEGLSAGKKYISVPLELNDYGSGTVKSIPAPEHYYLVEAKDEAGNAVDLEGPLRPKTDLPVSEIMADAENYYSSARPYGPDSMDLWLLYEVPESVREVTVICWLNDQFSQPHDAAFRLNVREKHDRHTFRNWKLEDILAAVQTTDRPELSEFAWFTPRVIEDGFGWDIPTDDPEYNGYEYEGGWKCFMIRDERNNRDPAFDAHLCNVYVENFTPDDASDAGTGHSDIRIDWYLAFDEHGNATDESGLPDLIIPGEEFYYNRYERDGAGNPFLSFGFDYAFDRAVGRGSYYDADGHRYFLAVVRKDGFGLWMTDKSAGPQPDFTTLPGTTDVPLPKGAAVQTGAADGAAETAAAQGARQQPASPPASGALPGNLAVPQGNTSSQQGNAPAPQGNAAVPQGRNTGTPTLNDFSWYFDDDFPIDGNPLTELQDLGGKWRGLLNVVSEVNGVEQCRLLVCEAEVQYMGFKVTLLLDTKERYEFPVSDPDSIQALETPAAAAVVLKGDWNPDYGTIDVSSEQTSLNMYLYDFVEAGGVQYALGSVFNGDTEIGEIAMSRP